MRRPELKPIPSIYCIVCGTKENFWDETPPIDMRGKEFASDAEMEAYIKENTVTKLPEFTQELYVENNRHLQVFYCSDECKAKLPTSLEGFPEERITVLADFNEREDYELNI